MKVSEALAFCTLLDSVDLVGIIAADPPGRTPTLDAAVELVDAVHRALPDLSPRVLPPRGEQLRDQVEIRRLNAERMALR